MTPSLYIHIPFCNEICSYCDFPKVFSRTNDQDAYLDALIAELSMYEKTEGFAHIQTLYIGGGTPSVLTIPQFQRIFDMLSQFIDLTRLKEFTVEANPESLNDADKVEYLRSAGVSRISLGVQTFQENHLATLERRHTNKDVYQVIDLLKARDFEINVDLIFAIPNQTMADLNADLDQMIAAGIDHVSIYALTIEDNTKFHRALEKKQLTLVDHDLEAAMYEQIINRLSTAGFTHYEISNFTRTNPSFHNQSYWHNVDYFGVGLGAHGQLNGRRYANTRSINAYIKALNENHQLPISSSNELSIKEQIEETMFLGLRLLEGINLSLISARFKVDIDALYAHEIKSLLDLGYVSYNDPILRLTQKGLMMGNEVFELFLLEEDQVK